MKAVSVHTAKSTLPQLIAAVEAGEEVVIMRDNRPVARLVPVAEPTPARRFGALAGQVSVPHTFFDPLPKSELQGWSE